jgi:2'-hydroxyisoflavone reductase
MKLLIIGGARFSGLALSEQALRARHHVTLFHRTPTDLLPGAEHVIGDRNQDVQALADRTFDAVVDTCGYLPRAVRASTEHLVSSGWYGFVSSISAHLDDPPPGATEEAPVHQPPFPATEEITDSSYGPLKVACEQVVREIFGGRGAVIRPGYIVGPNDPTDRFTSWVRRAAGGGEMLAPGPGEDPVQFVDARDLAAFMLHLAESATSGTYNVVHPAGTVDRADLIAIAREQGGVDTEVTWADPDWMMDRLGEDADRAFPMWEPGEPGAHRFDPSRAIAAGLVNRTVAETVHDTLAWDRAHEGRRECGLSPEQERELLAAWRSRGSVDPVAEPRTSS